ncbi:glycosyltransferase family 2 protein [Desulfallas sp. Bu1-1]|jgi:glycosyltransferase involved in cell wall biosynthesis|uniref:glycosyltransferase family 2 protein n=1 Tax=Desulfallas sp. Bu1-1 TaxID=2787620 RepID=UPI00189EB60E|nr:glycosyltransferase family 2 protein [Desulfallas sp. Bu1-1]MBF7084149.1 glycosyltransferase family 2 protein [Desulfallas sp. Bu1-1]
MFVAVIPAKNEAGSLGKVIAKLPVDLLDLVIPVLNGCTDNSLSVLLKMNCPLLAPLYFAEPLGIDVPRAVGAALARKLRAGGVLFLDGDMQGVDGEILRQLIRAVRDNGTDLALTNCYPAGNYRGLSPEAVRLIEIRKKLNQHLNLLEKIGSATPSHGPHAVSARLLELADPADFAIPPLLLARAARAGLQVAVHAETLHLLLGSSLRSNHHTQKILETITGDCLSALHARNGKPGHRTLDGREYIGYHNERRWDLLESFISDGLTGDYF